MSRIGVVDGLSSLIIDGCHHNKHVRTITPSSTLICIALDYIYENIYYTIPYLLNPLRSGWCIRRQGVFSSRYCLGHTSCAHARSFYYT